MPSSRLEFVVDGVKFGVEVEAHYYYPSGRWVGGWTETKLMLSQLKLKL